jgi:hypothetical protein
MHGRVHHCSRVSGHSTSCFIRMPQEGSLVGWDEGSESSGSMPHPC